MQLQINLASRSYVNRRGLYGFYAMIGGFLIVLLAFNLSYFLRLRTHAATLTTQLAAVAQTSTDKGVVAVPQVQPAEWEERRRDVAAANEILQRDGFRWTALLDRLEDVAVDGVSIRSIQPNFKEDSLAVTAVARSIHAMQEYLDRLLTSSNFSEIYLLSQSAVKETGADENVPQGIVFAIELKGVF